MEHQRICSRSLPAALPVTQLTAGAAVAVAIKLVSGGRTLRGTVSDATGGPVAGARIDAARLAGTARQGGAIASTFTRPDGTYRLTVEQGMLMVSATSPDYARAR